LAAWPASVPNLGTVFFWFLIFNLPLMQQLDHYNALLGAKRAEDPAEADRLEEEIDILVHKLKYIPQEQRPTVLVLAQKKAFEPLFNTYLQDVVAIAGGRLVHEKFDDPSVVVLVRENGALYGQIASLVEDAVLGRTDALRNNRLFIVHKPDFGTSDDILPDVEIAAEIIQPKYFVYGREGKDWDSL